MINHVRTIILNESGPKDPTQVGDVYIPDYRAKTLSSALENVYKVLFGNAPDYAGKLYRMQQYMKLLHSTEYVAYVTAPDPRITYTVTTSELFTDIVEGVTVSTDSSARLTVSGIWLDAAKAGRIFTDWLITGLPDNKVFVNNVTDGISATLTVSSQNMILPGSTLQFNVDPTYSVGDTWSVLLTLRPHYSLADVQLSLKSLPVDTLMAVFNVENESELSVTTLPEPYLTFFRLFTEHYSTVYSMSGFLLAYAYTIMEKYSVE